MLACLHTRVRLSTGQTTSPGGAGRPADRNRSNLPLKRACRTWDQDGQGLAVRWQAAPGGAALAAARVQQVGQKPQGPGEQINPGWVDRHTKLRADRVVLVDNPSTRSFSSSRARPTTPHRRPGLRSARSTKAHSTGFHS